MVSGLEPRASWFRVLLMGPLPGFVVGIYTYYLNLSTLGILA